MTTTPGPVGVPFARALRDHGDRLAVVGTDGTALTHRELADRVAATAAELGPVRRLVLVAVTSQIEALVTHLAALAGGHPVLLTAGEEPERTAALCSRYDPDVVAGPGPGGWTVTARRPGTRHSLHPDLALLLSTSGSTGSPKLVRLSTAAVQANAEAIGEYLGIRDTDRAAAMLPLHYCYGLSVVHSNLLRGAAVVLTEGSVTDPGFAAHLRSHGATSLHGVPHTFALLDRAGYPELPALRYVTQAGGRLEPDAVRAHAARLAARGAELFVMYGQTEATARMAYLPPELVAARAGSIGRPVPGGRFRLADPDPETGVGELLYEGPNVMLGYAERPADLARGREVEVLATGDLARLAPDGLVELVGRCSRFVKPFGLRVDLDEVERLLATDGITAFCAGDDTGLVLAVAEGPGSQDPDPTAVAAAVAGRLGLPASAVCAVAVAELPRRSNGKPDYAAVAALRPAGGPEPEGRDGSVGALYARVLRCPHVPPDATFASLGGDSLSYVQTSMALENLLAEVPPDWPTRTVAELEAATGGEPGAPARRRRGGVETAVLLRAVAIVLVVGSHIGPMKVLGGAHLLLALAGWSFARFALAAPSVPAQLARSALRIAVPTVLWVGWRAAVEPDVSLHNALLLNYLVDPAAWGYWFVESLLQILIVLAVLLAVPAVRRLERREPYGFALLLLGAALLLRGIEDPGNEFSDRFMSPHLVLWIFVLGWLVHRSIGPVRIATTALLVVLLLPGFFADPVREAVVGVGLVLVLLVPRVPLPRAAARAVGVLAAASLAIYLTHYAVYPVLLPHLPGPAVLVATLSVGVAAQWSGATLLRAGFTPPRSTTTAPGGTRSRPPAGRAGATPARPRPRRPRPGAVPPALPTGGRPG